MQNLTLNIAQYQTFNIQYCKHLLYSHYLDDNKLKILIQYLYLLVNYALLHLKRNNELSISKKTSGVVVCLLIKEFIFRHHFGWVWGDQSDWDSDNSDTYPWDFKTQSSLNIYLNFQTETWQHENWILEWEWQRGIGLTYIQFYWKRQICIFKFRLFEADWI